MRSADKSAKRVAVYTYAVTKLADAVGTRRALDPITRRDHEALFDALKTAGRHRTRAMLDRYGAHTRSARAHESFRRLSASAAIAKL
jgi:hypothetical protein